MLQLRGRAVQDRHQKTVFLLVHNTATEGKDTINGSNFTELTDEKRRINRSITGWMHDGHSYGTATA